MLLPEIPNSTRRGEHAAQSTITLKYHMRNQCNDRQGDDGPQ